MLLREGHGEIWRHHVQDAQTDLEEPMTSAPALEARQLIRGTKTGVCLAMLPFTVNGTEISGSVVA